MSGFGRLRRDFNVNLPDLLIEDPKKFALPVARQIMLIDRHLSKKEHICRPVKIDLQVAGRRLLYDLTTMRLLLEQQI